MRIPLNQKNIKLALGLLYLIIIFFVLYFFLSKFNYKDFTSYKFIQLNSDYLISFKEKNIMLISFLLIIFTILWVLLLGFGTPIALVGGFIFGKWLGTFLVVLSLTVGSSLLYIIALYFFKSIVIEVFSKKFGYLENKFKKQELIIMIIYRIVGLVPFAIANILPTLFNVKLKNYFLGTMIGITPSIFIMTSLGSGLENIISLNSEMPSLIKIITSEEIYIPIIGFIIFFILVFFIKSKFTAK
tara:strand:- start:590 stop:1318 length:729 start_codon:yes stop_codon:yes gene_type:complete